MTRLVSTATKIKQLDGMLDTDDLTEWETAFVRSLVNREAYGGRRELTERQLETLDRLWGKHFA